MNLNIDKDKCIGCGQCVSISSNVFDFDDDGLAKVIESPVKDEDKDDAMTATESCPTSAIYEE